MAPPTGPRAGASTTSSRGRGSTRGGGIQKRSAAPRTKIDRDGDIAMDAPTRGGGAPGAPGAPRGPSRGRKPHQPSRTSTRTAQNVMAYASKDLNLESGRGGVSLNSSKARYANTATLTVMGLDFSDTSDKQLTPLLSFLERKASKNQSKQITINKVCFNT